MESGEGREIGHPDQLVTAGPIFNLLPCHTTLDKTLTRRLIEIMSDRVKDDIVS